MKDKIFTIILTALVTSAIILCAHAFFSPESFSFTSSANAQNIISGKVYTTTQDTFVITTNSGGDKVFVYYFDAKPNEEDSEISFITRIISPK